MFNLVMAGVALVLGVTDRPFRVTLDVLFHPGTPALQLVLAYVLPAVEEIGLRGYWFDRLRERFSTMTAGRRAPGHLGGHVPFVVSGYALAAGIPVVWWHRQQRPAKSRQAPRL